MKPWLAVAALAAAGWGIAHAQPALVDAAQAGDTAKALALIAQGVDVNAPSSDGTTALQWAVHSDNVALIDQLLKAHANVRTTNAYGATPMSQAAMFGDVAVMRKLLKAGADVESANADGQTALMITARTGNVEAAKLLLSHGANVNARETWRGQTALIWAAAQSQAPMVKELLRRGAEADARSFVNTDLRQVTAEPRVQARPVGGLTSLLYASRQGCLACVQNLVEGGANVNLPDPDGVTPMLVAIENFHFDIAAYLLKKGANANKWDWWGRTPLYAAVDMDTIPFGGRPDRKSLDETTSLQLIKLLLDAGANPNAQLKLFPPYRSLGADRGGDSMLSTGTTPLLRAAKAGDSAAVQLLLAHHALVDLPNERGITPLMAAAGIGTTSVDTRGKFKTEQEAVSTIELLAAAGANVNARDFLGQTALHGAAFSGWNDVVKSLVAHNAQIDAKDARGKTPLDSAMGRAGGHGRGGADVEVHAKTAALLQQLMASNNAPAK